MHSRERSYTKPHFDGAISSEDRGGLKQPYSDGIEVKVLANEAKKPISANLHAQYKKTVRNTKCSI